MNSRITNSSGIQELQRYYGKIQPDRRQARHAHILQIDLRLVIAHTDARPVMPIFFR